MEELEKFPRDSQLRIPKYMNSNKDIRGHWHGGRGVKETRASHDFPVFVSQRALSLHVQRDLAEAMRGTIWGGFEKGESRDRYRFFQRRVGLFAGLSNGSGPHSVEVHFRCSAASTSLLGVRFVVRYRSIFVVLLSVLCHPALGEHPSSSIGMLLPLSGGYASVGADNRAGIDAALAERGNASGISFFFADSQADPRHSVSEFRKLQDYHHVLAV